MTQIVECIDKQARDKRLVALLQTYHKSRTNRCLIFVLYKKEAGALQVRVMLGILSESILLE